MASSSINQAAVAVDSGEIDWEMFAYSPNVSAITTDQVASPID